MAGSMARRQILTQMHMSLAFFFIFVAYQSLENIQSSLNFEAGLGTISISLVYAGYLCSSLIVGSPVVYIITPKWSLFAAFFSHTLFILANIYPVWGTMIPASLILGIAAGPYWIAQGTYSTVLAVKYTEITGSPLDYVAARFSSIFHVFWGASKPVGNLITSIILNFDKSDWTTFNASSQVGNQSWDDFSGNFTSKAQLELCGPNHCPYMEAHQELLKKPSNTVIYVMMGIFLIFNIIGITTAGLLRNVPSTKQTSIRHRLSSTVKIITETNLLLLILPSCLVGIIPGTYYASFAQSIISCIYGIRMVGYTMVCEGLGFTFASLVCGPLSKHIHRVFHITLALATFIASSVWFVFWMPRPDQYWLIAVISVIYGIMHGTFRTHISAMVSLLFPKNPEGAFAQYNIWMGVGFTASFAYTNFLCYTVKMYIFLGASVLTAVTYYYLEWRIKHMAIDEKGKSYLKRKFSHAFM